MSRAVDSVFSAVRLLSALALAALLGPAILPSTDAQATTVYASCLPKEGFKCIAKTNPVAVYDDTHCFQKEDEDDCYTCQFDPGAYCIKFGTSVPGYSGN